MDSYNNELIKFFNRLPKEGTLEYEKQIAKYSAKCSNECIRIAMYEIMNKNIKFGYDAFYVLCTYYRRIKDFSVMNDLIIEHMNFQTHITFNHIRIQYWVHSESFYDYDTLLEMAYEDTQKLQENAGFQQAFCNAFATICEQCDEEDRREIVVKWYNKAYLCIERAIMLDDTYAKFYSTKARILSIGGRYAEAQQLLNKAISMEDSSRSDYMLTIMSYQNYKLSVSLENQKSYFKKEIMAIKNKLFPLFEEVKVDNFDTNTIRQKFVPHLYDNYMFISYAHKDIKKVYPLICGLQKNEIKVWYDDGIKPGDEWPEVIGNRITNCQLVIIMLSHNAILSANVRREITMAISEDKKIIAVLLEDVQLSPGMKLQLGLCQMIKVNEEKSLIEKLQAVIKEKDEKYEW